jgi:hypothetical protein
MSRWARRAGTRDFCPALASLVSPAVQKFFVPHRTLFHLCVHIAHAATRQFCVGSPVS